MRLLGAVQLELGSADVVRCRSMSSGMTTSARGKRRKGSKGVTAGNIAYPSQALFELTGIGERQRLPDTNYELSVS